MDVQSNETEKRMMPRHWPLSRIAFRVDASVQIGTGHVMRCLALADAMRERGADCVFICRPHDGHLLGLIEQQGYRYVVLPELRMEFPFSLADVPAHAAWLNTDWRRDAQDTLQAIADVEVDLLVVDHYALDRQWEQTLRPFCRRLMVLDDLADRPHDCDLLLDQNLGRQAEDYRDLLPTAAMELIGPQYALLRPEFAYWRADSLKRRSKPQLKHLLITMGGVDKDNATGRTLDALQSCHLPQDLKITVVMGPYAPWLQTIRSQAAIMPYSTQVLVGVSNMASLMTDCDLSIGAAGGTAWERCCLGLPSIVLVLAENQLEGALAFQEIGAAVYVRHVSELENCLYNFFTSDTMSAKLRMLSLAAANVTDGNGIQKAINKILELYE